MAIGQKSVSIPAEVQGEYGENDRIIPPVYAEDFTRLVTGSELLVIRNAGHLLMIERAEVFAAAVSKFLNQD